MALTDGSMSPADYAAVSGNNGFGNDAWWIIILMLFGWGNGGLGGGNGVGAEVQRGFDQQALMSAVSSGNTDIIAAINSLGLTIANSCCDQRVGIANIASAIGADGCATRQVVNDGFRDMTYANFVNSQNQVAAMNAGFQSLSDKLCQLELDGYKRENDQLRADLAAERSAASQNAQTAAIIANNEYQTTALEQYLNPTPKPAYIVQNPNCCSQQYAVCA